MSSGLAPRPGSGAPSQAKQGKLAKLGMAGAAAGFALALAGTGAAWLMAAPDAPGQHSSRWTAKLGLSADAPSVLSTQPSTPGHPAQGVWNQALAAIEALARHGSVEAVLSLAGMAGESNAVLFAACRSVLSSPLSRWALAEGLQSKNPQTALAAAWALARAPGPDAIPALEAAVLSGDPGMRGVALQALLASGSANALQMARSAIEASDPHLAAAAAESLLLGGTAEGRLVLDQAARSVDPLQRATAARAFATAGPVEPAVVALLVGMAEDSSADVRRTSLNALSQMGSVEAAAPVLAAAAHGQPADRVHALELLGNMADTRAAEIIAAAIADPSPEIALAAIQAARYRLGIEADNAVAARLLDVSAPLALQRAAAATLLQHGGPLAKLYAPQLAALAGNADSEP